MAPPDNPIPRHSPSPRHNPSPRDVPILGIGAVTPLGVGVTSFVRALRDGRSGVRPLRFAHPRVAARAAAECIEFDPASAVPPADLKRLPRLVPMALAACREALRHAGLDPLDPVRSESIGLVLGTGGGGIDFTLDQYAAEAAGGRPSLWTITNATHGNLAGELSIRLGLRGPSLCVSTGCASGSDAAGLAMEMLRSSRPGAPAFMVVVGADAHVRWETLSSMELLGVLNTEDAPPERAAALSRPFDATRRGFVLGEGAWAVVLGRPGSARTNAALAGYGATCDAYHRVRPDPDMTQCVRAIRDALRDADAEPTDLGVVQYHGTSTPLNDAAETLAVKAAVGEANARRLVGSSVKGAIGHPQGAAGLAGLVATVGALTNADAGPGPFVPPTINLHEPDPACDLDYAPNRARAWVGPALALVNCLAFGAKNSALIALVRGTDPP